MEWIDEIIIGLLDIYATSCPYELCTALGIKIIKTSPTNVILLGNESTYIREHLGYETIFLRNNLTEKEELFFLKHELGHAILHPNIKNSYNKHLINKYKLEKQANYFALKLQDLNIDEVQFREMTIKQIASYIEVPYTALKQLVNI
ncbi:ImmA/IrrE family metallo-endopeptidase [Brassicibacter mesophilus]|uniref:ImmA/IrrE family metallo-endopeptidase n=1 Tax=Brassicibacter mesophilus TaxID=745119 RepID=UPI003D1D5C44